MEFRNTPSLPEAIRVRSPPQVLEAIKLTDIELSGEVKEYNMLDLGVSMTVETIDSIIPSYDGDVRIMMMLRVLTMVQEGKICDQHF